MSRNYIVERGLQNVEKATYYEGTKYGIPNVYSGISLNGHEDTIGFNEAGSYKGEYLNTICHFFIDDYQFERLWRSPDRYIEMLRKFKCVTGPDFSLSADFPRALQIFNVFRRQWLTRYLQENGVTIIPTAEWGDESTLEFAFEGIPKNSPVAVTLAGYNQNKLEKELVQAGLKALKEQIDPPQLLCFGTSKEIPAEIQEIMGDTQLLQYKNANIQRLREVNNGKYLQA